MKKLKMILVGLLVVMLSACSSTQETEYPSIADVEISEIVAAREVDMSDYTDMEEGTDNHFLEVTAEEMLTLINSGGTGIFYIGQTSCNACNLLVRYMEAAAEEVDALIYYVDAGNEDDGLEAAYNYVLGTLYDILEEYEGEKALLTPHVFAVKDGEFTDSQIGAYGDYDGTDSTAQIMIERYIEVFTSLLDDEESAEEEVADEDSTEEETDEEE